MPEYLDIEPIEHYAAKHAGFIPARFYKDREGVMQHLSGKCVTCSSYLKAHDGVTSFDNSGMGFKGKRISGDETD